MALATDAKGYVVEADQGETYWFLGAHLSLTVTGEQSEGGLAIIDTVAPRGHSSPLHVHEREDEIFYVVEGELRVRVGDDEHVLRAGATAFGPRRVPHSFVVTSERARYLLMATPAGFEGFIRELGEPALEARIPDPSGPPDMERLSAVAAKYGCEILGPPMVP
jgi:quercetin dioxygenase-like cupin family protein